MRVYGHREKCRRAAHRAGIYPSHNRAYFGPDGSETNKSQIFPPCTVPAAGINKNALIDSSAGHTANACRLECEGMRGERGMRRPGLTSGAELPGRCLSLINIRCHWQITEHSSPFRALSHLVYYRGRLWRPPDRLWMPDGLFNIAPIK